MAFLCQFYFLCKTCRNLALLVLTCFLLVIYLYYISKYFDSMKMLPVCVRAFVRSCTDVGLIRSLCPNSSQKYSFWLRLGQSNSSTPNLPKHAFIDLSLCTAFIDALSLYFWLNSVCCTLHAVYEIIHKKIK